MCYLTMLALAEHLPYCQLHYGTMNMQIQPPWASASAPQDLPCGWLREDAELPGLQQRRGHQCLSHGRQNSLFKDCFGTNPKKSVGSRWATPVGLPNDCWCQWVPGTICCAELYHHISSMPQKASAEQHHRAPECHQTTENSAELK